MFINELAFDMKTGIQAGKIRPASIGIIDLEDYQNEVQETIL